MTASREVEAILAHPDFYEGQRMVKPPVVLNAGLLRMRGRITVGRNPYGPP